MIKQIERIVAGKFILLFLCVVLGVFFSTARIWADDSDSTDDEGCVYEDDYYFRIYCDATWHKSDNLTFNKTILVFSDATLTIEKGANVQFEDGAYLDVSGGRIVANGTRDEPISITDVSGDAGRLIRFAGNNWEEAPLAGPSFLRYVEIYGGGWNSVDSGAQSSFWRNFIPSVYATAGGDAAVLYRGGRVHFENCTFRDNAYSDVAVSYNEFDSNVGAENYLEIVNSNFEKNDDAAALISIAKCKNPATNQEEACQDKIILKEDWYGDPLGPWEPPQLHFGESKAIEGDYKLEGWRENEMIADPVIVIPGIMGSAKVFDAWQLDPIAHTYDNLVTSLAKNGYEKDKSLFEFPYDWEESNETSSIRLQSKIEDVIHKTGVSKVDLVAHSMGGLVARAYIEEIDSHVNYADTVDKLITLGTPESGAPKAYLYWEAGEGFFNKDEKIMQHHFTQEAKHMGYDDLYTYIQDKVISVRELLPDYDYLRDSTNGKLKKYYDNYPRNIFLEELNDVSNLEKLSKVNLVSIVGNVNNDESTISEIRVDDKCFTDGKWKNGMPENFYNEATNQGLNYLFGDGTVPLYSAKSINSNKEIIRNSFHGDLPTKAQCDVFEELTGKSSCGYVDDWHIPNILLINVFSPIDIQVIAPDGIHWAGKNINGLDEGNQIPGAYYTGYDGVENEFLSIPNPADGEYQIVTQGTGNGNYKVEVADISEGGSASGQATEGVKDFTGMATIGRTETLTVNVADLQSENETVTESESDKETVANNSADDGNDSGGGGHKKSGGKKKTKLGVATGNAGIDLAVAKDKKGDIDQKLWPTKNDFMAKEIVAGDATNRKENVDNEKNDSHKFLFNVSLTILIGLLAGGMYWRIQRH